MIGSRVELADPPADLDPVDAGQHHVEDDDLRPPRPDVLQGLLAGAESGDRVIPWRRCELESRSDRGVVFNEEDARHPVIVRPARTGRSWHKATKSGVTKSHQRRKSSLTPFV